MGTAALASVTVQNPGWSAWLLSQDARRRRWLTRMLVADALFMLVDVMRVTAAWSGHDELSSALALALANLVAMGVFYVVVRSGLSADFEDPALTRPQVIAALCSLVLAYGALDTGRGAVIPLMSAVLAMGLYQLPARALVAPATGALLVIGAMALLMSMFSAAGFDGWTEAAAIGVGAASLPALSALAHRAAALRERHARQHQDLQQAMARLEALATRDALTGLVNHRHMLEVLQAECKRHSRGGRPFCLAMVDIDFFQRVNEEQGRDRGDELLKRLATLSQAHLRASDVMARWGGEEFLILMPDTDLPGSQRSLDRWREHLSTRLGFYRDGRWVAVSSSAGVTRYRDGETIHQTLGRVEQALLMAKTQGRDQVVAA